MTHFDWLLVIGLNGAIIVYGLFKSRETKSSSDWFLAGRTLPWWVIGFSLWATAIDASDIVAAYRQSARVRAGWRSAACRR